MTSRWLVACLLAVSLPLWPQKRPLTHHDYNSWKAISSQKLSSDGRYLAYLLYTFDGDGELVVRNLQSNEERRVKVGYRAPVAERDPEAAPESGPPQPRGVNFQFTADNRKVVFGTFPEKADLDKARKEKKKPEEMPKNGMGILDLASGEIQRFEKVLSFQVPEKGTGWVAYRKEGAPDKTPSEGKPEANDDAADQARRGAAARPTGATRKEFGSDLVLRNLADNSERTFAEALEYSLSKDARTLVYTVASRKNEQNGVFVFAVGGGGDPKLILGGKGSYSKLTWDDKQTEMALLSDKDDDSSKQPKQKLYLWTAGAGAAEEVVSTATAGFRAGFVISERGNLSFSKDGKRLFFGTAPPAPPRKTGDETEGPDEKVSMDLWHWKDDNVQPMQKVRAEADRNRNYRAVYHVAAKKLVQAADPSMAELTPVEDTNMAIGSDDRAYRHLVEFDERAADFYTVNLETGERKPLARKQRGTFSASPDGRYAVTFDGKNWKSFRLGDGKEVNLTGALGVAFQNEEHDVPGTPTPYGPAGWTKDGQYVLLYDRYDVWQFSPDGSLSRNLTAGYGRKNKIQLRYVRFGPEESGPGFGRFGGGGAATPIDPKEPLLLRAENLETRDAGFFRTKIDANEAPEKLLMAARNFSNPVKAKDADVVMLTAGSFEEFPDIQITDSGFRSLRKASDANPQRAQFRWGTAELIPFRNTDGVPLQAVLYKPENFDPSRKYPMIVYIYERLTQNVHRFVTPSPGTSINISYYVSNGYLVLTPDIAYTLGYPGPSALKCVLPAVQAVADKGFLDENAIGIQGHSWGGYQISYMVTQTTRFKAAAPGAPVANMTSAYDGIRWGSGLPRQFQYERTQSRIGGSLWQYPERFLENSPLFHADRIRTPLLILHNDADDAVPWYQGIELFLAMRRLGKEAYMCTYNGEPHGIRRHANQRDYTMRLQQFFDHFLKGAPKPEWMERGVPFLEKETEKEKWRTAAAPSTGGGQ